MTPRIVVIPKTSSPISAPGPDFPTTFFSHELKPVILSAVARALSPDSDPARATKRRIPPMWFSVIARVRLGRTCAGMGSEESAFALRWASRPPRTDNSLTAPSNPGEKCGLAPQIARKSGAVARVRNLGAGNDGYPAVQTSGHNIVRAPIAWGMTQFARGTATPGFALFCYFNDGSARMLFNLTMISDTSTHDQNLSDFWSIIRSVEWASRLSQ